MRRRTASYRLRPDHKAAVAALANDNSTGQGETIEELVEQEARARYGPNWREIVRVRVEGNGAYLEAVSATIGGVPGELGFGETGGGD